MLLISEKPASNKYYNAKRHMPLMLLEGLKGQCISTAILGEAHE
jgi:hypothetical protein